MGAFSLFANGMDTPGHMKALKGFGNSAIVVFIAESADMHEIGCLLKAGWMSFTTLSTQIKAYRKGSNILCNIIPIIE